MATVLLNNLCVCVCVVCTQATAVLTSKHFAQRQPWRLCVAATPRSMAAASNWSWMSPPSFWGLATSARPWGQSSQPPRGHWLPQAEPCLPPSGPCWPALSPWCWKLCSESSPMLSALIRTTHMVGMWHPGPHGFSCIICLYFLVADCCFSHLDSCSSFPRHLSDLLVRFPCWHFCNEVGRKRKRLLNSTKCFVSLSHWT